ncbi:hypothetical protein [uncultured Olleya sp.]|uniref:hypothetical protein n=1 Tax=uncultured Olleya sp. TaxID=757243 RepID=UPI002595EB00|nr:hypothetical protein [uncultured Olleya sp.]
MKTFSTGILVVFVLFFFTNTSAQTFQSTEDVNNISSFDTQSSQDNFLLNQSSNFINTIASDNSVFITQIGDDNDLISKTIATESDISIIQSGNQNQTILDLNSVKLTETILQNGNNNTILDYSPFKSDDRHAIINQKGNNQNLIMTGSNSLSEKIKISMKGQDQSIIIRNF